MGIQLVWLKRDLRVDDHGPLREAARLGPVLVCYVYEPSLWAEPELDPSHLVFINQSLAELEDELQRLGIRLLRRRGELPEVFGELHAELPFETIHAHEETGLGLTYARDRRVQRWCRQAGVALLEYPQFGVFRPHPSREGWAKRWEQRMSRPRYPRPERISAVPVPETFDWGRRLDPEDLGLEPTSKSEAQPGGASHGRALLNSFLESRGENYRVEMSSPVSGWTSCSRLSPHIAYGTLSLRDIYQASERHPKLRSRGGPSGSWAESLEAWGARLRWHCHFIQKLEDEPALEFRNAHRAYDGLRTESPDDWGPAERRRFQAWIEGRTGFPMVDACMRCLHRTGWINFRMRAMLASFACHHLWLHWRTPARALARHFLDFEPGIHFSQFQMQAGTTGVNSYRIYNVTKQAFEQDPQGIFIKKHIPQLRRVPDAYLRTPHRMPSSVQRASGCRVPHDYPSPIVDAAASTKRAQARLEAVRRRLGYQAETARVVKTHGSRRRPGARRSGRRTLI